MNPIYSRQVSLRLVPTWKRVNNWTSCSA